MATKKNRSTLRWRKVRALAWERDRKAHSVCHLCCSPIDYTLPPSSCEDAWEPDHIVPFSKNPDLELDLDNIAASHRRCNRARGKNDFQLIGRHSRIW